MTTTKRTELTTTTLRTINDGLPAGATAITWVETRWTECRAHIEHPSWRATVDPPRLLGIVHFDDVECDACAEA